MRLVGLVLTAVGFLAGTLFAVLDPKQVDLALFLPALGLSALGVGLVRFAASREAQDEGRLEANFEALERSLGEIARHAEELDEAKTELDVYDLPGVIDERFPAHIEAFVEAREAILHVWGSQSYADVMSSFAAGERYLNRAWSTAVDGYIDEAHDSLAKARLHLGEARQVFLSLPPASGSVG